MAASDVIIVPIPPNQDLLPGTVPTNPATRLTSDDLILEPAKESDLLTIAAGLHRAFPEKFWWLIFEPYETRPAEDVRAARYAARMRPVISHAKDFTLLVARIKETGELAGCAGWHHPTTLTGDHDHGSGKNLWLCDLPDDVNGKAGNRSSGWESGYPWKSGEKEEAWTGIDAEKLVAAWASFEEMRHEELKGEPHWYLAPFYVEEKFRGRGIARVLLQWAIDQADGNGLEKPTPMYLEGLPNARPVYLHMGFRGVEGVNRDLVMIRRGVPSQELTPVDLGEARNL